MNLNPAVQLLHAGRLVAFPTETVYGLGADARNSDAVGRIFAAKGRPSTNPLIVHVSGVAMAKVYARVWPNDARLLGQAFWPGPLTLVLPKHKSICTEVCAGGDTVGLRVPNHPMAIELIRKFDGPIAAPSANRSTHVSPTTAQHVRDELGDSVDLILDGGPCGVGIESTVLDLSESSPRILRPGAVTREQIERAIGRRVEAGHVRTDVSSPATSPGQHDVHYAPLTPAFRYEDDRHAPHPRDERSALIMLGGESGLKKVGNMITMPSDPIAYARHLYAVLREVDAAGFQSLFVEMPPDRPEWTAVRDRIRRATRPVET